MNTRSLLILFSVLVITATPAAHGALGQTQWTSTFNSPSNSSDSGLCLAVDGNGNVIVAGSAYLGVRWGDFVVIKYSPAGTPLWTNYYGGPPQRYDEVTAIAVHTNGDVFVTGYAQPNSGSFFRDFITIAYSSAGAPLWTNRYDGPSNADDSPSAIAVDRSGNVFVTGFSYSTSDFFSADYATIAYSAAGVPLWTNRYDGPGESRDEATAIVVDVSGNVFVTGESVSALGWSDLDVATVKYSSTGVPLWTNRCGGPVNRDDHARSIAVDGNGNVFVAGSLIGSAGFDYLTLKYSNSGTLLWSNVYQGVDLNIDIATRLAVDPSGNVIVTGYSGTTDTNYDYVTVKYSGAGVPFWTNRYDGIDHDYDSPWNVTTDRHGNVFVTGTSTTTSNDYDCVTVAYSSSGQPLWTNRFNGPANGEDAAYAIGTDASGNVFVTGESEAADGYFDIVTLKYTAVPATPVLSRARVENGNYHFQFLAESNVTYAIEFRDFLDSGVWMTLTNVMAPNLSTNVIVTGTVTNSARFFRVRTP